MKLKTGIFLSLIYFSSISSEVQKFTDGLNVTLIDQIQVSEVNELGEKIKTIENFFTVNYDTEDISAKLAQICAKLSVDQKNIFKKFGDNIQEYQKSRNENLQFYSDKVNFLADKIINNLEALDVQQLNIKQNIESIQENIKQENEKFNEIERNAEMEYIAKLQELHEKKYLLNALLTQHCEDCDEIKNYELDFHYAQNDVKILELQTNFLKHAEENKKILNAMELENTKKLNSKYSELNAVLQKKIDEYAKQREIDEQNGNIINEWKIYTQNIEVLYSFVESKISDIFNSSLSFNQMPMNDDNSSVLSNDGNKSDNEDVFEKNTEQQQDYRDFNTFNSDDNNNENIDFDNEGDNSDGIEAVGLANIWSILNDDEGLRIRNLNTNDSGTQENTDDENNQITSSDNSQNELPESTSEISVLERQ